MKYLALLVLINAKSDADAWLSSSMDTMEWHERSVLEDMAREK